MALDRPKTNPETPYPKAVERAVQLGILEERLENIQKSIDRLEAKQHPCVQDAKIATMDTRHRVLSGILGAVALAVLGSFGLILGTCQATSHAAGVNETRIENHSARIGRLETSIAEMNKAREADTLRILEAIRSGGASASSRHRTPAPDEE